MITLLFYNFSHTIADAWHLFNKFYLIRTFMLLYYLYFVLNIESIVLFTIVRTKKEEFIVGKKLYFHMEQTISIFKNSQRP